MPFILYECCSYEKRRDTDLEVGGPCEDGGKVAVMLLQAKESQSCQKLEEARKAPPLVALEGAWS